MSLEAEALLMVTGLLQAPDRTAVLASRTVLQEVTKDLLGALDLLDPAAFRAIAVKPTYIDKAAKGPFYEAMVEQLEDLVGLDTAGAYQLLHQQARLYVTQRYPGQDLTGIVGSVAVAPSETAMTRWRLMVDTIENQRIGFDTQGAALLPANVEAFKTCFPESYQDLADKLRGELERRSAAARGKWRPSWWQDAVIRVFLQAPPKPAPLPPASPPTPSPGKVKLNTEALEPIPGA